MGMKLRHQIVVYDGDEKMNHLSALAEDFDLILATSPESLQELVIANPINAIVIHFGVLSQARTTWIEKLNGFTARLPIIVLADQWDLEAVQHCGRIGIHAVLDCAERPKKKLAVISSAVRMGGFGKLFVEAGNLPITWTTRMKKAYEAILGNFPNSQSACELSASLKLHRRSFEKEFRKTFGLSYGKFVRALCMYESWYLMHYTDLDNSEISAYLRYREETHFARDCRKVFGLNPTQMRELPEKDLFDRLGRSFSVVK